MANITAANSVVMLSANKLYNVPIQLQGFSADDIFGAEAIDTAEVLMGVDGKMSSGFIHVPVKWSVTLQADSGSNAIFDAIYGAEKIAQEKFILQGVVVLPSIGTTWVMNNGVLTSYQPVPDAKKVLQPRKYTITWESVSPSVRV